MVSSKEPNATEQMNSLSKIQSRRQFFSEEYNPGSCKTKTNCCNYQTKDKPMVGEISSTDRRTNLIPDSNESRIMFLKNKF